MTQTKGWDFRWRQRWHHGCVRGVSKGKWLSYPTKLPTHWAIRVQRKYTKRLPGLKTYSYESRLQRLNLITLELRRLVWCYKIVFGLVDVKFDDFFKHTLLNHTRGSMYKLYKQRSSTKVVAAFFVNRVVVSIWYFLPEDIVDFSSLTAFKKTIKLVDFNAFLNVLKCT